MFPLLVFLLLAQQVASETENRLEETIYSAQKYNYLSYALNTQQEQIFFYDELDRSLLIQDYSGNLIDFKNLPFPDNEALSMHYLEDDQQLLFWDSGLGRVFLYDLESESLKRLDKSFAFRSFYGHGAWVDDDLNIYAMGGYGLFQNKNLFLKYDADINEWNLINEKGEKPDPSQGLLVFDATDSTYYYFSTFHRNQIDVYALSMETREWISKGAYKIPGNVPNVSINLYTNVGNQKIDPETGIIHITGNAFYEIKSSTILFLNNSTLFSDFAWVGQYHKTGEPGMWTAIGRKQQKQVVYGALTVHFKDLKNSSEVIRVPAEGFSTGWILVVGILFSGGIAMAIFQVLSKKEKPVPSMNSAFVLEIKQDLPRLQINGIWDTIVDPTEQKFWKFTHQQLRSGINRIDLKSFDDEIFGKSQFASQTSKKRKILMEMINKRLGQKFVFLEVSSLDKRYKELVYHGHLIKIEN